MRPKRRLTVASPPLAIAGLLVLLLAAGALPARAAIIDVPADRATLQAAVAAAASGDTILFAPGTYVGGVWVQDKSLVFASWYLTTGDTSYISQTVLSGLVTTGICGGDNGCTGDASLEFGSHTDGSAVIGLSLTGAVKGIRTSARLDFDHCKAYGMTGAGDGVNYLPRSSGTISNSVFMNNRDDGIDLNGEVNVNVINNIVRDNWDDGIEFRMYPWAGEQKTVLITGNLFISNDSDAIQLIDSPDSSHRVVRIERNLFYDTHKAVIGCMANQQTIEDYSGAPIGERVVFANNTCVNNFYGVVGGANSIVLNNLFVGTTNSALRRVGGNSISAYNLFWSNGLDYEASNLDLAHTLRVNPLLDANHKLTSGSPAINAGTAFYQWRGQTILNLPPAAYTGSAPDLGAYEFGGAAVNVAPAVNAGTDQFITLPADAVLDGTVSDDGLPSPPGGLTITWTMTSGPAAVTFDNASAVDTRAHFTTDGTYQLRLTASDGALSTSDVLQVTVQPVPTGTTTIERRVATGTDDAEEDAAGAMALNSSDLELVFDGSNQWVGLRFTNIALARGAPISRAWLQFVADEVQSEATNLTIRAEAADNPITFSFTDKVSTRARTTASATWAPPAWNTVGEAGSNQRSTELAAVIQEIVSRPGWTSGNAITILINGTGHRTARGFEAGAATAPLLHIESGGTPPPPPPPPPPPTNTAPVVDAGPARFVTLPGDAQLDGTVTDDGLPAPPGAVTTTWSVASAPGPVSFQSATSVDTRATFTVIGSYLLRLTASDGALTASDTVRVTVQNVPAITLDRRVAAGSDDAEESAAGSMQLGSTDLELVFDFDLQWVGLRFANLAIPPGTSITRAWLQFETDEVQSEATTLAIRAQAADNAPTFTFTDKVSTRPRTTAVAGWSPPAWTVVGEAGPNQRSVDLSAVIQEVVNRPGWASGNAIALLISGTGHRTARAFEALPASAPLLHIEAGGTPPPPANAAPLVNAGPDLIITLPADAYLDGQATDDGMPNPPGALTTTWSVVSGPGPVVFENSAATYTRTTFTTAGNYLIALTASDGALSTRDSMQITIEPAPPPPPPPPANAAPVANAGPDLVVTLPAGADLDGTVSDDGLPDPPALTAGWSVLSGPGTVAFVDPDAVDTRVTFSAAGEYLLQLSVNDGLLFGADTMKVTAQTGPPPPPANTAPIVNAGPDRTITLPAGTDLDGTVSDDGLPDPPAALTTTWSKVSGPGTVAFDDAAAVDTRATFSATGEYLLRLSASDGLLSAADTVQVTVQPEPPPPPVNTAPVVNAGADQTITLPADANLDGTVSDDGLPDPPAALTTAWSAVSGPASVAFDNPAAVDTRAVFTAAGTYLLRLAASDGLLAAADTVQVTVQPEPPPPPPVNTAPVVSAGSDQTITLPADADLDGTVSDDGLPDPPAALTTTWSVVSGPGAVTFAPATAVDTRATFAAAGAYVLRLTASDGQLAATDDVQVVVQTTAVPVTVDRRIAAGTDDAEESAAGSMQLNSTDIELVFDSSNQWIGLRFTGVAVPPGATINRAWIQFMADEVQSEATNLTIRAHAADNPTTFSFTDKVSTRPRTTAAATWTPAPWTVIGEIGTNQRTSDVAAVVQEIVNRPGWASGNAIAFIVNGTGHRTARAFEALPEGAALLHIEASTGGPPPPPPPPPPPTNTAPVVDAGPTQTLTLPSDAVLDGTVTDDGLPSPPAAVTTTWSVASGPGPVTFLSATAADTRATFATAGTYLLRLTANDGGLTASDTMRVTVQPVPTVERRVAASSDDAEESATGVVTTGSSDLELVFDGSNQWVGLRFTNLSIASGVTISRAYVQFQTASASSEATSLIVRGQAADNATAFTSAAGDISGRPRTAAAAGWSPPAWSVVGEAGANQRTTELAGVIQEIVNRPGWTSGNAVVILINGTGRRVARSLEGLAAGAPLLHIETGGPPPPPPPPPANTAPVVDAGANQTIALPADAILDGTVSDDGFPNPPGALTTTWSVGSGPGPVTFQDAGAVDTRAGFTTAGTYILRLTAGDGGLSTQDSVQIIVQPVNTAPVVEAGPNQTITLPSDVALDGTVSDDGLPSPPGALTTTWSVGSGPGPVTFQNASLVDTRAAFTTAGAYILRLTAGDGALTTRDSVQITVQPANAAPVVDAGPNQTIVLPSDVALDGTVSDDGRPTPPGAVTTTWSVGSGPGPVTFQDASLVDTRAAFTTAGTYILRLTAGDGALTTRDSVQITVQPSNIAPVVDAGPNQTITLPSDAVLDGTVSDDGRPTPPALTTTWSVGSGPGPVTFQSASVVDTRATFTTAGTYWLRLTASDGALSTRDSVQITVQPAPIAFEKRVAAGDDDAEEVISNNVLHLNSSDLEMADDGGIQSVGMRFTGIAIPRNAIITRAWIQFEVANVQTTVTNLTIRGEAADNPVTFSNTRKVVIRPRTSASRAWAPPAWSVVNEAGANQRTPDIATVVQEIVNRAGWASGNALVILVDGTGRRNAWSWNGKVASAPLLHVEYTTGAEPAAAAAPRAEGDGGTTAGRDAGSTAGRDAAAPVEAMSPAAPRAEFAFHGLSPNPTRGPLRMEFSLSDFAPASVEVLDITGRRVAERALGSPGPGRHTFELREALPPGVYMVRLVHGSRAKFTKAVIIR